MDPSLLEEIERQLSMDTDRLFRMLASENSLGASPGTSRDGKAILENARRTFRQKICSDERVRYAHGLAEGSKVQSVAAILDCVSGSISGVSPVTVAVLLVKEGVEALCQEAWRDQQ